MTSITGFVGAAGAFADAEALDHQLLSTGLAHPCTRWDAYNACMDLDYAGSDAPILTLMGITGLTIAALGTVFVIVTLAPSRSGTETATGRVSVVAAPGGGAVRLTVGF
jgi:hypothetical protein